MSEEEFWRSTPRKVGRLWREHKKFHEQSNSHENKQEKKVCIDEVPFL